MAPQRLHLGIVGLMVMLTVFTLGASDGSPDNSALFKILKKREAGGPSAALPKSSVAVPRSKAQEFLAKLSRTKRNIWDRSRPDVQQWIMQFMYMGYDEQRLETDLAYWRDQTRAADQGRQHHYDENAPIGPRDHSSYRHGANVNYDYY